MLGPKFGKQASAARASIEAMDGAVMEAAWARGDSVTAMIDGNATVIDREDVVLTKSYGEDWAGAADGLTITLIDKRLTPALKNEGLARDIVRNVQNLRKEVGLDIEDRIRLSLVTESSALGDAVAQCREYIAGETLAVDVASAGLDEPVREAEVTIDGNRLVIGLVRAS